MYSGKYADSKESGMWWEANFSKYESVAFSQIVRWWNLRRLKIYDKDSMTLSVCPNFKTCRDYVASHCLNLPRFMAMKPHGYESAFIRLNV